MGTAIRSPVQRSPLWPPLRPGRNVSSFVPRSQPTPKSAGSAPPDEFLEQLVALAFRDRARSSGRDLPLLQKLIELFAPVGQLLLAMVLEPIVSAFEPLPARDDGGEIGVLPLR